jgi:hypothetical protein
VLHAAALEYLLARPQQAPAGLTEAAFASEAALAVPSDGDARFELGSAARGGGGHAYTFAMSLLDFRTLLRGAGLLDGRWRALVKPDVIFVSVTGVCARGRGCARRAAVV